MVKDMNGNEITLDQAKRNVGIGWGKLIEQAYKICEDNNIMIMQIKEKFGSLRFYTGKCSEEQLNAIEKICSESSKTCEYCGREGKIRQELSWMKCLCSDCLQEAIDSGARLYRSLG